MRNFYGLVKKITNKTTVREILDEEDDRFERSERLRAMIERHPGIDEDSRWIMKKMIDTGDMAVKNIVEMYAREKGLSEGGELHQRLCRKYGKAIAVIRRAYANGEDYRDH